jgi:hypothetical protein
MSTQISIFPDKDGEFNVYFGIAVAYLTANAVRLGIDPSDISALAAILLVWNTKYPLSLNSALSTHSIVVDKNNARTNGEALLRKIFGDIPNSALTTDDRSTLHLELPDSVRTAAGVPAFAPDCQVTKLGHLYHVLCFSVPETGSHAKPEGVASIEVYTVLSSNPAYPEPGTLPGDITGPGAPGAPGAPANPEVYFHHVASTGRFLVTINYTLEKVGRRAFFMARYKNTRGEFGPYSQIFSALVN